MRAKALSGNPSTNNSRPDVGHPTLWQNRARRASLLLGLTWLAFAVRVLGLLQQSLWRDEVDALIFATRPLPELLAMFRDPGQNGPLFFLTLRPWLAATGHSEYALRFPAALAGTLAVPVGYALLARLTASRPAALITAALLAVAPYLVWYGQEAKMYAALTVLVPAALLLTLQAARHGGWQRWLALYLVTSLGFYTHLLAALAVPVQALWLLLAPVGPRARRRYLAGLGYLAALILPYLPLARWQLRLWLAPGAQTGYPFVPLGDILTVMWSVFSHGVLPVRSLLPLFPFTAALIAALALWPRWRQGRRDDLPPESTRNRGFSRFAPSGEIPAEASIPASDRGTFGAQPLTPRRVLALLLIWLFLPPVALYVISLVHPIFTERYLIWTMPAYLGLMALGCIAFARIWRPAGVALLIALLAVAGASVIAQGSQPIKSDFRAAAAYVLAARQQGDVLVFQIPYNRHTFSYYANGRYDPDDRSLPWADGPYTNNGMTEAEAAAWLTRSLGGAPAAWLIASEVAMWDSRGLTEAWFAAHGRITDRAEFARVTVTRYVLGQ